MNCYPIENHPHDSRVKLCTDGIVQTLPTRMGTGGNNTPFVLMTLESTNSNARIDDGKTSPAVIARAGTGGGNTQIILIDNESEEQMFIANSSGDGIACPLDASYYKGQGLRQGVEREFVMMKAYMAGNGQLDQVQLTDVSRTLDCMHDQKIVLIDNQEEDMENSEKKYVLRRLTPTECARLQGFPDWWCDGANGSDSAQYKLWGNGIALPCVAFIMENIAEDMNYGSNE